MASLDLQPLDIQPLEDSLDIQPLDIQPLQAQDEYSNEGRAYANLPSDIPGATWHGPKRELTSEEEKSTAAKALDMLQGAHEVPLTLASGMAAIPAGVVMGGMGFLNDLAGGRKDTASLPESMEAAIKGLTYAPKSDTGKALLEKAAPAIEGLQALGPTGYGASAILSKSGMGRFRKAEIAKNIDEGLFKPKAEERVARPIGEQMQLDLQDLPVPETQLRPAEAGAGPLPQERGGIPSGGKRQMELPTNEVGAPDQISVDATGEAVRSDANPWDLYARDVAADRVAADLDAQLEMFQNEKNAGTGTPMERVAQRLGADEPLPPIEEPAMSQLRQGLEQFETDSQGRPVQRALDDRQAQLEMDVKRQAVPELMAAERARQETAPLAVEAPKAPTVEAFPELSLADLDAPLHERRFTPNAADRLGNPLEIQRTVTNESVSYKAFDDMGNMIGQVFFEQNPDGSLGAGHVQSFALKRGIAESMYKQAKEDGFTIRPGRAQTEDGMGLVKRLQEKGIIEKGELNPITKFVQDEAARIESGVPMEQALGEITDPAVAKQVEQALPPSAKAPLLSEGAIRGQRQRQGGYIKLPFGKGPVKDALTKNERAQKFLEEMRPFELTPDEFVAKYQNAPDMGKDRFSHLSASGMYMAQSSQSPLVKFVTDLGRKANSNIKALTRDFVHESYAPAVRALNKEEFTNLARLMSEADLRKQELDLTAMKNRGFSDKAIQVVRQHQDMMGKLYPKLKEAAERNGMAVPENRTAYAASLMQGDFRRVVRDAEGDIVGVLGGNTRKQLNRKMRALEGKGYTFDNEVYSQGGGRDPMGFTQLLQQLADGNPKVQALVDTLVSNMSAETYLGGNQRTMGKKGVFGTAGRDPTVNAYQNAKDFFDAQIRYAENIISWNEMTKFVADSKKVMEGVNGQENAKGYLNNFVNGELGRSTNEVGRKVDSLLDTVGKETGLGTTLGREFLSATKKLINAKLLGLNVKFLVTNMIQPIKVSPEMTQYLSARGLPNLDPTGLSNLGTGLITMLQKQAGKSVSGVMQGALDYAQRNHVYGSDLFESSNNSRRSAGFIAHKISAAVAQYVERVTRQAMFLSMVEHLNSAGVKAKDGLYQVAHKLTDMAMVDYDQKPMIYSDAGAVGNAAANLMTYKHNELSRLALFARELPRNQSGRALAANLASQVAVAGVMGLVGYAEADWAVRKITESMGKPQGLTEMLLKNGDVGQLVAFGPLSKATGIDFSGSLGMEVAPSSLVDAALPGVSSLGQTASAVGQAVSNPSDFNLRRAGREGLPLGMQGVYDRQMFSTKDAQGQELAISPNTSTVTATRNDTDKAVRNWGFTGVNESQQKKLNWEAGKTEKFYEEKRKDAVKEMRQALFTNEGKQRALMANADFKKAIQKFMDSDGNPENLESIIKNLSLDLRLTPRQEQVLKDAASNSITNIRRLQRNRR